MKQSFGQKGAGGRFLALALALIMLCSVLVPAYAAVVDEQGVAEQNEPAATGSVTYIFHVGETVQEVKVASGEALTKPTDPNAPEGEVFKGWFVDNDLNKPFTFRTTVSTHADETVHLYAHFADAQPASTEQQDEQQPAAPGTSEEPKQPETNTPTDGGEENNSEQGSTENNENQTGENQNTENNGENTGDTTTPSEPTTPTDPVTPVEPIVPAEVQPTEGEVQPVDELYNRLMACTTLEEINAILNNLTEEENALLEQFTEEQNAALEDKMAEFGAYGIDTLDDESYSTPQNSTLKIAVDVSSTINSATITKCTPHVTGFSVAPYTDDYDSVERGLSFTIGENVPVNDYILTVQYTYLDYSGGGFPTYPGGSYSKTETITIKLKVTQEQAQVYYLKTPTSKRDSNDTSEWGTCVGNGTVNTTGATWKDDKNIFSPIAYVLTMPDGMVDNKDGTWELPKEKFSTHFTAIFTAYKAKLESDLGVTLDSEDEIEAIYLTPYKISKNNSTVPDKHIDCTISVKTTKVFAAVFLVTMPDGTVEQVDAKNYKKEATTTIAKTDKAPTGTSGTYPETITNNGITYVFDGWYDEDENKVTDDKWNNGYAPSEDELADGTVYFKAKYVPATTSVTISKLATGKLGSTDKEFTFSYEVYDKDNNEITTGLYPDNATEQEQKFTLKGDGFASVTISNLPVGGKITFTEETYEGYTLYYQLGVDAAGYDATRRTSANSRSYTHTIESSDGENKILFINDKDPVPDTGLTLDSWPYLLALCFVTLGAVVTLARGRRRDVD